jgi:uncharacterized protein YcfJ
MTERPLADQPATRAPEPTEPPAEGVDPSAEPPVDEIEDGLVAGRPVEDRSFEVVEIAAGASLGVAIGAVVAGPVGAGIGGVVGAAAGFIAGETIEHAVGRAAETIDAVDEDAEPPARA